MGAKADSRYKRTRVITWRVLTGLTCNFAWSIRNVHGFNGPKWQEIYNIHLLYNKTIVDSCFCRHGVLLNSKFIILTSALRRSIWRLLFNNTPCPPKHLLSQYLYNVSFKHQWYLLQRVLHFIFAIGEMIRLITKKILSASVLTVSMIVLINLWWFMLYEVLTLPLKCQ